MRRSVCSLTLLALLACHDGGDGKPVVDTPSTDTDLAVQPDTDPRVDTDAVADTDPAVDTDWVMPNPPASWGGGLTDISTAAFAAEGVQAFLGDPSLQQSPQTAMALFVDLDDDDRVEVLVDQSHYATGRVTRALRVFRYDRVQGVLVRDPALEATLSVGEDEAFFGGLDLDGDGHEELFQESADLIWWPDGRGGFTRGVTLTHSDLPDRWKYSTVSVLDLDEDGWLDMLVGADNCAWSFRALIQTGNRTFDVRSDLLDAPRWSRLLRASPMVLGDGATGVLVSASACENSNAPGGFFVRSPVRAADDSVRWVDADLSPADARWKLDPATAGVPYTAAMPMGGLSADLDGDLLQDLLLSLGSAYLGVLRALPDGSYRDASLLRFPETWGRSDTPWGVVTPDLDGDGVADLVIGFGDDATSFFGYEGKLYPPRVYWGAGRFNFEDVTTSIGVAALGSWHGITMEDLDDDADPDLAVVGYGNAPLVLRDDVDVGANGLALRLRGTTSNPLGFGARVELEADGLPERAQLVGGDANMDVLARGTVFFGLGPNLEARTVRVRWPSGVVQEVHDLAAGQTWTLTEPPCVTLSEADRHLPADGSGTVQVSVWPRDGVGDVRPASTVTLALGGTPVTVVEAPTPQPDGSWRATLRAPSQPGSTRVEAWVDGVAYQVAPRIWWD